MVPSRYPNEDSTDRSIIGHQTLLTTLRKTTAPFLPPPILCIIHLTDSYFHRHHITLANSDYIQSEPSVVIVLTVIVAYLLWRCLRFVTNGWISLTRRSTVHLSELAKEDVLGGLLFSREKKIQGKSSKNGSGEALSNYSPPPYQETVVICGALGSGKTSLLHYLCQNKKQIVGETWSPPMTVTSLVANVAYVAKTDLGSTQEMSSNEIVRIIDYPGHSSLSSQLTGLLLPNITSRVVFAIDSTQPVMDGVLLLYQSILTHSLVRKSWAGERKILVILVVCTKSDAKGAKNYKRIKIQVRNELDKLRKVDSAVEMNGSVTDNHSTSTASVLKGKTIDLDNLGSEVPVKLHFMEAGFKVEDGNLEAVREFVLSGKLPSNL